MKKGSTRRARWTVHNIFVALLSAYFILHVSLLWATSATTSGERKATVDNNDKKLPLLDFFGANVSLLADDELADALVGLPTWIQEYVRWHRSVRRQYPGMLLWESPTAPKLLLRNCFGICGGLNDRLGQLTWDLYLANQTGRVLLLHWHRPLPLEQYLSPRVLDWRLPGGVPDFFPTAADGVVPQLAMRRAKFSMPGLFDGMVADKPMPDFWERDLDLALQRATVGEYASQKVLRHRLLGHLHEHVLEQRLRALGETDMLHATTDTRHHPSNGESRSTLGQIFGLFFQPSPRLQVRLDEARRTSKLQPGRYSAVHCRVRHPKVGKNWRPTGTAGGVATADKSGLVWEGRDRQWAIQTTEHALQCATTIQSSSMMTEPIYILADSSDLVHFFVYDLRNSSYLQTHQIQEHNDTFERSAYRLAQQLTLVSRPIEGETVHLDLQKGRPVEAYDSTFIDFYLMLQARCLVFGVGNFAWFAAKLSGTPCRLLHQTEAWGGVQRKLEQTRLCLLNESSTLW